MFLPLVSSVPFHTLRRKRCDSEPCLGGASKSRHLTPLPNPLGVPGGSPLSQSDVLSLSGGRLEGRAGGESEPLVVVVAALFEEAFVEQLRVARPPLVLQAEQQVPEVDSGDALSHELPGAGSAGAAGLRGP